MKSRRRYKQFCGLAKALDVVGERWTLLIVRDLILGPRRYSDLLTGLPGITTNLLAERLRQLEEAELIERVELPPPSAVTVYRLTPAGRALEPAVMALAAWGGRYLSKPERDDTINMGWGFLSMKRRYRGVETPVRVNLRVDGRLFHWQLEPGALSLEEGLNAAADAEVSGTPQGFRALFFEGRSAQALEKSGTLQVAGAADAWHRFVNAFGPVPRVA